MTEQKKAGKTSTETFIVNVKNPKVSAKLSNNAQLKMFNSEGKIRKGITNKWRSCFFKT